MTLTLSDVPYLVVPLAALIHSLDFPGDLTSFDCHFSQWSRSSIKHCGSISVVVSRPSCVGPFDCPTMQFPWPNDREEGWGHVGSGNNGLNDVPYSMVPLATLIYLLDFVGDIQWYLWQL